MRNVATLSTQFASGFSVESEGNFLVSGVNGERDDAVDQTEIERRWRTPAPVEWIGGTQFSLWKTKAPLPAKPPRFSRAFFAVAVLGSVSFIVLGAWVARRIRQGDFLAGQIFFVGYLLAVYGSALIAIAVSRRTRLPIGEAMSPPEGVSSQAVTCHARVSHRGRCVGWLWFEGDVIRFQGVGFDFRLRREDFKCRGSLFKEFKAGGLVPLNRPKGVSEYWMSLLTGKVVEGAFVPDRSLWKGLEDDFAAWERGSFSREPSLFPPIRPVPTRPVRIGWATFVVPALLMGTLTGFARVALFLVPVDGRPTVPAWQFAVAGTLFGLMWPFSLWESTRRAKVYAREADRAARRESNRA